MRSSCPREQLIDGGPKWIIIAAVGKKNWSPRSPFFVVSCMPNASMIIVTAFRVLNVISDDVNVFDKRFLTRIKESNWPATTCLRK